MVGCGLANGRNELDAYVERVMSRNGDRKLTESEVLGSPGRILDPLGAQLSLGVVARARSHRQPAMVPGPRLNTHMPEPPKTGRPI